MAKARNGQEIIGEIRAITAKLEKEFVAKSPKIDKVDKNLATLFALLKESAPVSKEVPEPEADRRQRTMTGVPEDRATETKTRRFSLPFSFHRHAQTRTSPPESVHSGDSNEEVVVIVEHLDEEQLKHLLKMVMHGCHVCHVNTTIKLLKDIGNLTVDKLRTLHDQPEWFNPALSLVVDDVLEISNNITSEALEMLICCQASQKRNEIFVQQSLRSNPKFFLAAASAQTGEFSYASVDTIPADYMPYLLEHFKDLALSNGNIDLKDMEAVQNIAKLFLHTNKALFLSRPVESFVLVCLTRCPFATTLLLHSPDEWMSHEATGIIRYGLEMISQGDNPYEIYSSIAGFREQALRIIQETPSQKEVLTKLKSIENNVRARVAEHISLRLDIGGLSQSRFKILQRGMRNLEDSENTKLRLAKYQVARLSDKERLLLFTAAGVKPEERISTNQVLRVLEQLSAKGEISLLALEENKEAISAKIKKAMKLLKERQNKYEAILVKKIIQKVGRDIFEGAETEEPNLFIQKYCSNMNLFHNDVIPSDHRVLGAIRALPLHLWVKTIPEGLGDDFNLMKEGKILVGRITKERANLAKLTKPAEKQAEAKCDHLLISMLFRAWREHQTSEGKQRKDYKKLIVACNQEIKNWPNPTIKKMAQMYATPYMNSTELLAKLVDGDVLDAVYLVASATSDGKNIALLRQLIKLCSDLGADATVISYFNKHPEHRPPDFTKTLEIGMLMPLIKETRNGAIPYTRMGPKGDQYSDEQSGQFLRITEKSEKLIKGTNARQVFAFLSTYYGAVLAHMGRKPEDVWKENIHHIAHFAHHLPGDIFVNQFHYLQQLHALLPGEDEWDLKAWEVFADLKSNEFLELCQKEIALFEPQSPQWPSRDLDAEEKDVLNIIRNTMLFIISARLLKEIDGMEASDDGMTKKLFDKILRIKNIIKAEEGKGFKGLVEDIRIGNDLFKSLASVVKEQCPVQREVTEAKGHSTEGPRSRVLTNHTRCNRGEGTSVSSV